MNSIRPWLFIGKYVETKSPELLNFNIIGSMLHLAEKFLIPGINTLYLPVEDGKPVPIDLLIQGVDFVLAEKQKGGNSIHV